MDLEHAAAAAAIAAVNAVSNATSIWTTFTYSSAPRYVEAMAMNCATAVLAILVVSRVVSDAREYQHRYGGADLWRV